MLKSSQDINNLPWKRPSYVSDEKYRSIGTWDTELNVIYISHLLIYIPETSVVSSR